MNDTVNDIETHRRAGALTLAHPPAPRLLTVGERAVLAEFETLEQVIAAHESLRRDPPTAVVELVPAARTLLVVFDPALTTTARLAADLARAAAHAPEHGPGNGQSAEQRPEVAIPVVYDGPDLAEVAERTGLSAAEAIARHSAAVYTVAFCGFAPGFAYLTGLDPALRLPRRRIPRTRVPAGSVAVCDGYSSVYPQASPGGWHLLGRTDAALWDTGRRPPALLAPGTRVRFTPEQP